MKFAIASLIVIAFIAALIYFAARDAFVPQPFIDNDGITAAPTSTIQKTSPPPAATSSTSSTQPKNTFAPPTSSFRGPTGAPHINGPSNPPPNY